jgi:hypothetical protein
MLIHTYFAKERGMGLGDFIRGSIAANQLCVEYSILFEIDFRQHPIGQYLQNQCSVTPPNTNKILDLQDIQNATLRALQTNLKNQINLKNLRRDNLHIYTNVWPMFKLPRRIVESVRKYLQPTEECERAIVAALDSLTDYEVIHIRVGDILSFGTQIGDTVDYTMEQLIDRLSVVKTIQDSTTRPCIIMSDSAECKRILAEKYGLRCTSTVPSHMALENDSALDTLVDFFILSRARHIHQFSVHGWGSGFSDSVHWLYRVPITKHKLSPTN